MIVKNNPFNIESSNIKWKGLVDVHDGLCEFSDIKYSVRAMAHILMWTYRKTGTFTYSDIVDRKSHIHYNNQEHPYLTFLCKTLQVKPDDQPKNVYQFARLLVRMAYYESSFVLDLKYAIFLINHFKIKIYEN